MKLILKSLKQISYEMNIDNTDIKVEEFKKQIEAKHGFDAKGLKLIYNNTILEDSKQLSDYNLADDHVIMMISSKAKPINVNKQEEEKKEEPVPKTDKPKSEISKPVANKPVQATKSYDKEVQSLVDMGFGREQSTQALTAAKGDVQLAIEYLYNGIPSVGGGLNPQLHEFMDEDEEDEEYEGPMLDDLLSPEVLATLDLNNPNTIKTIASVVKIITSQDSSQLPDLLADIEETNPEIIEYIKNNESAFREELEKPLSEQDLVFFNNFAGAPSGEPNEEQGGEQQLEVEGVDKEVVERLKALGFTEEECIQAYIACDKDEMLAANLLIEGKYKDMEIDCKYLFNM
jgi:UV excision repair protein RAD23